MNELYAIYQDAPVPFLLALSIIAVLLFLVTFLSVYLVSRLFNKGNNPNIKFVLLVNVLVNALIWGQVLLKD